MDAIVKRTIRRLKKQGADGTVWNVVITRLGPWTLSYVKGADGSLGVGASNNEAMFGAVPEDVEFVGQLVGLNAYEAISKLQTLPEDSFVNSLIVSIASALSHRFLSGKVLRQQGFTVQRYRQPDFPLFEPQRFVKSSDTVAMVGFHMIATPLCVEIAQEVRVTELMNLRQLDIADFRGDRSNIKLFPADQSSKVLEGADVVFITGQTLVNGTASELLALCKTARATIIYGPTAALHPEVLFHSGVDIALPIIFPTSDDFRQRFVESRGYWYQMPDVEQLLISRGNRNTNTTGVHNADSATLWAV